MADRLPQQYANLQNNFPPGLVPQQGQVPVDLQMNAPGMSNPGMSNPGLANSEQGRLWMHQQQLQQLRAAQAAGSGGMGAVQGNNVAVNQQVRAAIAIWRLIESPSLCLPSPDRMPRCRGAVADVFPSSLPVSCLYLFASTQCTHARLLTSSCPAVENGLCLATDRSG